MNRRTLVQYLAVGTAALAGCASGGDPGTGDTSTDTVATDGGADQSTVSDSNFTVTGQESGTQVDEATVQFDAETVRVDGTIWGSNGCKTAVLGGADYTANTGELTVAVVTTDREDAGDACTQAIVEIGYEAEVRFEGGRPDTVVVTHDRGDGPVEVTSESAPA